MLLAIIAIIATGTACLVGMLSTFENLEKARIEYYSKCRMADFWVQLKKIPISEVRNLLKIKGISEIRTRISFPVIVDLEGINRPIGGILFTLPENQKSIINNVVLQRGSYFSNQRRDEVIIAEKFAQARGISMGSYIHLILNGKRKKLFVVGTAISSEHMYLTPKGSIASNPKEYGLFFIKRSYAEEVFGFHGACNEIVGFLTPNARKRSEGVLKEIDRKLSSYGVFQVIARKDQFSHLALYSEMHGLQVMAVMLPMIFLGVAALVLNVLMTRLAEQQRTIVGTFKALGYSNHKIYFHFLNYGLFVGLVGGISGCILGHWMDQSMIQLYRTLFEFPKLPCYIYPKIMLFAIIISTIFSVAGTLRGVSRVVRLSPAVCYEASHAQFWRKNFPGKLAMGMDNS